MKKSAGPKLVHSDADMAIRVVRDIFNEDFEKLVVSGDQAWEEISTYVEQVASDLSSKLSQWASKEDIFAAHRIDEQLAKAMDRKVYLPSGGSLVIDRTEAMTVVDVNTGKFTGTGGTLEETVTKNNLEAAEEIVRQLRLRDIGGIIVIDFIDMVLESNRDLVLRRLVECLGRDRTRHQVAEVTSLGLVQMTRKRVGQGLVEAFSETCEHCSGRGYIVHDHPVEKGSTDGDGGRRRKRNGGGRSTEGRAPAPVDEQQSAAAREAVKATLATIAAAAAQAHAGEDAKRRTSTVEHEAHPAALQAPPAAQSEPTAPAPEKSAPAPEKPAPEQTAPKIELPTPAEKATGGRKDPAGDAAGETPSEESAGAVEDVRASLEALAAALPTREEPAGDTEAADSEDRATDQAAPAGGRRGRSRQSGRGKRSGQSERSGRSEQESGAPGAGEPAAQDPAAASGADAPQHAGARPGEDAAPAAAPDTAPAGPSATAESRTDTAPVADRQETAPAEPAADATKGPDAAAPATPSTDGAQDGSPAGSATDAEDPTAQAPRRRRGHRRVTSGGPITA